MTKSTITRERLQELAEGQSGFNLRTATHEESQELARMALAAMDSEPVAWREPFTGRCVSSIFYQDGSSPLDHGYEPIYSAPQEPVVPSKWITVSERMPEVGQEVLCVDQFENYEVALYDTAYIPGPPFFSITTGEFHPTHWMPLPAAPQEAK